MNLIIPRNFTPARHFALCVLSLAALAFAGCSTFKSTPPPKYVMKFYMESRNAGDGRELTMPSSGLQYWFTPTPFIPEGDVTSVALIQLNDSMQPGQPKSYGLRFTFSTNGAINGTQELYVQTAKNQGKKIFLFINDLPFGAHPINQVIQSGTLDIYVDDWVAVTDADKFAKVQDFALDLQDSVKRIQDLKKKQE